MLNCIQVGLGLMNNNCDFPALQLKRMQLMIAHMQAQMKMKGDE